MGHYAVILQLRFRLNLQGQSACQVMARDVSISQDIEQGQHRRDVHHVDQELSPKVHASINHSATPSYNAI